MTTSPIRIPDNLVAQKRFRRILDIIVDSVSDELADLTDAILVENGAPPPPDPNDNEAYDAYHDELRAPVDQLIWNLICDNLRD